MGINGLEADSYTIRLEPSGREIRCRSGQTLLDAVIRNDMSVLYGCRHGNCSSCKARVIDGDYELMARVSEFALMSFEREDGYILMCCTLPESDMIVEVEEEEPGIELFSIHDFTATITENERVTHEIHILRARLSEPFDIPYAAGQYFEFHIPGLEETSAFSMASDYERGAILEFHVKRIPGNRGSNYLADLKAGHTVTGSGPYGRMQLRNRNKDVVMVAEGSGLAPIKALLHKLFKEDFSKNVWLFYGARSVRDLYLTNEWVKLANEHSNFHIISALSNRDAAEPWDGEEGFIADVVTRHFDALHDTDAYLSGPPVMIQTTLQSLYKLGVRSSNIFYDEF